MGIKPLFDRARLADRLAGFFPKLSEAQRQVALAWARTAADPALREWNEKPLQGQFLNEIFGTLLGYAPPVGHLHDFQLKAESASAETKGSKTPDGRLGFFGPDRDVTRAVIELKAPGTDLDARQAGHGKMTPVEQGFSYLPKFDDCRWVIVSNFTAIRLYSKKRGEGYCHEFLTADLAGETSLAEFLFLLGRERLLGESPGESPIDLMASAEQTIEETITRKFYARYDGVRSHLFRVLR